LVATSYFFKPDYLLLAPKMLLFNDYFAFSAMFFMALRGFIYTISADIYAYRLAFSGKTHCILHHFTLRFAPKRIVFSTKTHCI